MLLFREKDHKYWHKHFADRKYRGATTFLKVVEEPYDDDYWSSYKAVQSLLLVQSHNPQQWYLLKEILGEDKETRLPKIRQFINKSSLKYKFLASKAKFLEKWKKNRDKALERGNRIHKEKEDAINKVNGTAFDYDLDYLLDQEENYTKKDYDKESVDISQLEFDVVYAEVLLFNDDIQLYDAEKDEYYYLCGTADVLQLTYDSINGKVIININDWKTNKKIDVNNWFKGYLLSPCDHLMECNYNKYRLQISLYAYLIRMMIGWDKCEWGEIKFTHIDHFNIHTEFKFPPLIKEIKAIIDKYQVK